ncbi:tetratricopeptide repeat protein [Hymenobacter properus]|uniref:Tetratricopeptide repeat protein n=1 Tax=Hymenobacter properus TaxID=2791026 RepID=A0A931BAT2_9BACT|nr:tetratricopeptide repeat protein [Hymenobacter properus]MBF9140334.1 tetratricopeptide repeat protein [Hymenobacter properus]MBR7719141.1 tetratricopeptide repeat protein [Microvirga sp. SRT04]
MQSFTGPIMSKTRFFSSLALPLLGWAVSACQTAPDERADTLVNLATVQSGPRVQADELNGAIERAPQNTALLAKRATLRLAAGQPRAALADVEAALAIDDTDGSLYFLQARTFRALGQLKEALAAARQAAEHGFGGPELPLLVGETHLAARNYPAALDNLDRTLRLDPDQPAALFYKGLAYAATADTSTAVQYLQDALARDPREPEILHQLAFLLNAWRIPEEAAKYAAQGMKLDTTSGLLRYDYGRQLELQGRPDSALWYYRRALALDTTVYRADYRLGLAAAKTRQPAAVIQHLTRALRRNPRLPEARALLAEALETQNRLPEALAQYRQLVAENPGNAHWTFKVWKTNERVQASLPDSLRTTPRYYYRRPVAPARPQPIAPLPARAPSAD